MPDLIRALVRGRSRFQSMTIYDPCDAHCLDLALLPDGDAEVRYPEHTCRR